MKIGLIDVDGHNFPNLALMRISAYHKQRGDDVEWWWSDFIHYDIVYKSKVFSDAYSKDVPDPLNADLVIKGGTGYCISLVNGVEVFDKSKNVQLPPEVEKMFPDYSIYPQYRFAVAMTSRGCPRGCAFCHVAAKEGRCATKVADVRDFWCGQSEIHCCDPNILACRDKRDLLQQYSETGALIDFNQGLDIRLMDDDDIADIKRMKINRLHFAWDNPDDDLLPKFELFSKQFNRKSYKGGNGGNGVVFCLTNFGDGKTTEQHIEEALKRIYALRDLNYKPFVMVYDKPHASREIKLLQRWCNNPYVFYSTPNFEDYDPKRA